MHAHTHTAQVPLSPQREADNKPEPSLVLSSSWEKGKTGGTVAMNQTEVTQTLPEGEQLAGSSRQGPKSY